MSINKDKRHETMVYLVLWAILFAAPVLSLYVRTTGNPDLSFNWAEVFMVWRQFAIFLLIFLLHNYLLAPLLVYRQRRMLYLSVVGALIAAFVVWQCTNRPDRNDRRRHRDMTEMAIRHDMRRGGDVRRPDVMPRPDEEGFDDMHRPPEMDDLHGQPPTDDARPPLRHGNKRRQPALFMGQHDVVALIILVLMLGMNLGVKLYFKQHADQRRLDELEKQNIAGQLEYLKYQINPHFLMNTLNNIHALVDVDPEKAKDTIVELSKMLRFLLYEGSKTTVPLEREVAFLKNYIRLMSLRYTDRVRITTDIADSLPVAEIPPLMFITFVENAFKHGVSYQQESFVDISMSMATDGRLAFVCANSKRPASEDKHGGVGLQNVKRRLELIYGNNYELNISDEADRYVVSLTIPLLG